MLKKPIFFIFIHIQTNENAKFFNKILSKDANK